MTVQPRSRALFGGGPWPREGVYQFNSADDCLAFMFGAPQHDQHVKRWRTHQWLDAQLATYPAREAACRELIEQWRRDRIAREEANRPALEAYCAQMNREFEERWAERMAEGVAS